MTEKEVAELNAEYEAQLEEDIQEWNKERLNGIKIWIK